jgi:hypothetical protein
MEFMRKWAAGILLVVAIGIMAIAQTARDKSKGPFLWDDQIMEELRGVRAEHRVMMGQITTNTEKIASIERTEKDTSSEKIGERLIAVETKLLGLEWIASALGVAIISNLIHSVWVNLGKKKKEEEVEE